MELRKKIKRGIAVLLCMVMTLSLAACQKPESKEEKAQREFNEYCDQLFLDMVGDDAMLINFTFADPEKYGIKLENYSMGEYTVEEIEENEKWIEDTLNKLNEVDASLLTERQQLSLKTLIAYFEKQNAYKGLYMLSNPFTTNTGVAANANINFIEFIIDDEEDVKLYLELIRDTERYIGQILDFAKLQSEQGYFMPSVCVDKNVEICENYLNAEENPLIASFNEKVAALDISEDKKNEYIALDEQYINDYYNKAYQNIIDTLTSLKGTTTNELGLCYFENGKEYYTAIVKEKSSSDMGPEELIKLLDDEMTALFTDYSTLYYSDQTLLDQYMNLDFGMGSAEEILTFLADNVNKEFPEPYTKDYIVKYQSKATEIEGTLAYYLTARLDELNYNSIKVNRSAFGDDYTSMYSTLAHEGFPGHLYQYTGVYGNEEIPDACKLLGFIGFTEGFAEYASDRAYVLGGCSEELAEFIVLNDMYGYIIQARIDLGIHYEGWDKEECAEYCAEYGIDESVSDNIFDITVSDPGLLIPYAVGHIEMRNLRDKAERKLGDAFDAVEFHKLILDTGLVTFEIMNDELDKYIKAKKEK